MWTELAVSQTRLRLIGRVGATMLCLVLLFGPWLSSAAQTGTPTLREVLQRELDEQGVDAMLARYEQERRHDMDSFAAFDADVRALASRLSTSAQHDAASRLLERHVLAYPDSMAAWRALAQSYLRTKRTDSAVNAYQSVLRQAPTDKEARYALYHLTGRWPGPFPLIVVVHVLAGAAGILAGFAAMMAKKGTVWHARVGRVFVGTMCLMSVSASLRAVLSLPEALMNFWMGLVMLYFLLSSWQAIRQRPEQPLPKWLSALFAFGLLAGLGLLDVARRGGPYALPAGMFGVVLLWALFGDWRLLRSGRLPASQRVLRHLWRMGMAMFIAVASFFLGQAQVFPLAVQQSSVLLLPVLAVILVFGYWAIRQRFARRLAR